MTGMHRGVGSGNPLIVSAFHTSLVHQFLIIGVVVVVLALAWNAVRAFQFRRQAASPAANVDAHLARGGEPQARVVLRLLFGALWTLDGLLQLQPSMPIGLPGGVLSPAASGAPDWVQHVVNVGVTLWSNHPITAAASAVWIQLGIGIGLLVAPRGAWSRSAGMVSAGWGLVVWVFGEALGGLFTPGSSWLFGLPGAALFYVVAGLLLALPEASWRTAALGRRLLRCLGALFVAMGVLQAWPGRGFWAGRATHHAAPGLVTSMASQMAQVPQPGVLASAVRSFGSFDAEHGWGVNLFVVIALLGIGVCLLSGERRLARVGVLAAIVVCLANWVLVQDFGFFGGVGTDPNSMLPTSFLLVVGYLAMVAPAAAQAPATAAHHDAVEPHGIAARSPVYLLQVAAALCAAAVVLIGAAPMAVASLNPHADPILTEAINGTPEHADFAAFPFSLVDEHGRRVTQASLRGHVVVLTFLDPVCTTDCPLIAQQLRSANGQLGAASAKVEFVAIDANPTYLETSALLAFDRHEQMGTMRNWQYLTGPLHSLDALWIDYGVNVSASTAGAMAAHEDIIFVISPTGRVRSIFTADPGGTSALGSSLSTLVVDEVQRVLSL
jgi:cytochrome oxidase Cu insertion factor (SCO1/SenC/PrrC family)